MGVDKENLGYSLNGAWVRAPQVERVPTPDSTEGYWCLHAVSFCPEVGVVVLFYRGLHELRGLKGLSLPMVLSGRAGI